MSETVCVCSHPRAQHEDDGACGVGPCWCREFVEKQDAAAPAEGTELFVTDTLRRMDREFYAQHKDSNPADTGEEFVRAIDALGRSLEVIRRYGARRSVQNGARQYLILAEAWKVCVWRRGRGTGDVVQGAQRLGVRATDG